MQISHFAIVELPTPMTLTNSALGMQIPACIGTVPFSLHTPSLLSADLSTNESEKFGDFISSLGCPEMAKPFITRPGRVNWGSLNQADRQGRVVARVENLFAVFTGQAEGDQDFVNSLHRSNPLWIDRLDAFIRLLSGQRTHAVSRVSGNILSKFEIYEAITRKHRLATGTRIHIQVSRGKGGAATADQLARAVELCSQDMELPLHYQLLIRAFDAHQVGDPRTCVLEAATALEVATTNRIRSVCKRDKVPEKHLEFLLDGHQTLRNRLNLLKKLRVKFPATEAELAKGVLEIRNKTVHGGYPVTECEAQKLLIIVDRMIREIAPELAVPAGQSLPNASLP